MQQVIMKFFPDFRKIINELQRLTQTGGLSEYSVANMTEDSIQALIGYLKARDFTKIRRWVVDNLDNDYSVVQRAIYDRLSTYVQPASIPELVMTLANYDYRSAFVADKEINLVSMLVEVSAKTDFK
jgi:replication factor C small subunit